MKIVIAPDKFKGVLSAAEVGRAIARGFRVVWPDAVLIQQPIADGGEGFARALAARLTPVAVHDALGRIVKAEYGWLDDMTAVIEMSEASGLWRISLFERNPLRSSTFGTGELILDAIAGGAATILLGIGGSATNDGGIGMAAALGYRFIGENGETLAAVPANLPMIHAIEPPDALHLPRIVAACDVDNPLLGPNGATCVYGPQKGVASEQIEFFERGLERLAEIVRRDLHVDFRNQPGAGAAGGLGFGLMSFCNAEIRSGFDLVAEFVRLEEAIAGSDLVVTAEGRIDAQTLHGKGPFGVARLARKRGKRVVAFCGLLECGVCAGKQTFDAIFAVVRPGVTLEQALQDPASELQALATEAAGNLRPLLGGAATD